MRYRREGYNTFSKYKNFQGYCDWPHKLLVKSFQITLASYIEGDKTEIQTEYRKFKHQLKQFFYYKSKEGYYKERFILIDTIPETIVKNGGGTFQCEIFLFTQEDYEKKFILPHVISLFDGIDSLIKGTKKLTFSKYKEHAKKSSKEGPQEKSQTEK